MLRLYVVFDDKHACECVCVCVCVCARARARARVRACVPVCQILLLTFTQLMSSDCWDNFFGDKYRDGQRRQKKTPRAE